MGVRVTFLGSGGTFPTRERNTPSIILSRSGEALMFDCGEGTQRQLLSVSVSFMKITKIFITHLHGDHYLGLPGLLQSMALNGRENNPLEIYAPEESAHLLGAFLSAGHWVPPFEITINAVKPGQKIKFDGYRIESCKADHPVPGLCYAYIEDKRAGKFNRKRAVELGVPVGPMFSRLKDGETIAVKGKKVKPSDVCGPARKGLKIVYSGDTATTEELIKLSKDADLLILDSTSDSKYEEKAQKYGHMSSRQAADIAKRAKAQRLMLVHISPRYDDTKKMLEEATDVFSNTEIATDFLEESVKYSD